MARSKSRERAHGKMRILKRAPRMVWADRIVNLSTLLKNKTRKRKRQICAPSRRNHAFPKTRERSPICAPTPRGLQNGYSPKTPPNDFCERGALPEDFGNIEIIILYKKSRTPRIGAPGGTDAPNMEHCRVPVSVRVPDHTKAEWTKDVEDETFGHQMWGALERTRLINTKTF